MIAPMNFRPEPVVPAPSTEKASFPSPAQAWIASKIDCTAWSGRPEVQV
jgi:hypothetical protein